LQIRTVQEFKQISNYVIKMATENLTVELCSASGLEDTEYFGKSDPYVVLSVGKTERKTKAAEDQAAAPKWNEKLTIPVLQTDTEILIRILNDNTMAKDDEIGRVVIPISGVRFGSHEYPVLRKGKPHGELKLNFEGEVHESKGLFDKFKGLFVGEKTEHHGDGHGKEHKEHHDEKEKAEDKVEELKEEAKEKKEEKDHEDKGLIDKVKEKIEDFKEKEDDGEKSEEKKEDKDDEDEEKKEKKSKKDKKSKKSDDEGSSSDSGSDSESDKED
jgi:hypothetical protein